MKCPKDADDERYENKHAGCQAAIKAPSSHWCNTYYCTRKEEHKGKHHCHSKDKECVMRWTEARQTLEDL